MFLICLYFLISENAVYLLGKLDSVAGFGAEKAEQAKINALFINNLHKEKASGYSLLFLQLFTCFRSRLEL